MNTKLTVEDIYSVLSQALPSQNNFYASDYVEELNELLMFGITTQVELQHLISKHREELLMIDSEELDEFQIKAYTEEFGEAYMKDKIENNYWFAYPALLRIALELEFGQAYIQYADARDHIA